MKTELMKLEDAFKSAIENNNLPLEIMVDAANALRRYCVVVVFDADAVKAGCDLFEQYFKFEVIK